MKTKQKTIRKPEDVDAFLENNYKGRFDKISFFSSTKKRSEYPEFILKVFSYRWTNSWTGYVKFLHSTYLIY
jgi:hypothetical protein